MVVQAYFPLHVNNNHYITIVMHTVKQEFQVLNSGGKISPRVHKIIETLVSLQFLIHMDKIVGTCISASRNYTLLCLFFSESRNWYRYPAGKLISTSGMISGCNFVANKGVRHAVTDGCVSLHLKTMSQVIIC